MIESLFFDVDDTLYDQLAVFKRAVKKYFTFPNLDTDQLYKDSRQLSDLLFTKSEAGEMSRTDMQIYRIQQALAKQNYTISKEIALAFQQDYANFQKDICLSGTMMAILSLCRQANLPLGIITNGPVDHQKGKINQLCLKNWIVSDRVFISAQVGLAKPDPALFEMAQTATGSAKGTCCYIGDSFDNDVVGAKNAGWQIIWFNRRNRQPSAPIPKADFEVGNERALYDLLTELLKGNYH